MHRSNNTHFRSNPRDSETERIAKSMKYWEDRGHHVPRYNAPFRDSYSMDAHFMEVERKAEVAERMK